jgi:outer membrane protein assembly factor BamB
VLLSSVALLLFVPLTAAPSVGAVVPGGLGHRAPAGHGRSDVGRTDAVDEHIDWATFGFDVERSGHNPAESELGAAEAAQLQERWSADLHGVMTAAPVEAAAVATPGGTVDLVYVGTERGDFYAVNLATGSTVWQRNLGSSQSECFDLPDGVFGIGGAATIDRVAGAVYVAGGDGAVHAMDLATGDELPGWPVTGVFDPDNETVYGGLTQMADSLYVAVSGQCDSRSYHGALARIDIPSRSVVTTFLPSGKRVGGSIWGPGGASIDPATSHVFVATGDTPVGKHQDYRYSEHVVELSRSLHVLGANHPDLHGKDADFGATPLVYHAPGCPVQAIAKNKFGLLVNYRRGSVEDGPTQAIQVANRRDWQFNGIPAYSPETNMVYIGNSSSSRVYTHGMVALSVGKDCRLALAWQQPAGPKASSVSPPVVANGVVYYGDGFGSTEYAFDASSGARLWTSGSEIGGALYAEPIVVNGLLIVASWDEHLHAFGP